MSAQNNGGPAFPTDIGTNIGGGFQCGNERWHCPGLSIRDYFAAKAPLHDFKFDSPEAMADFAGSPVPTTNGELISIAMACAAKAAYIYADEMLKARGQ